ncbi:MAG: sensor histidine kinase, partial [Planctomycetota bacterium]
LRIIDRTRQVLASTRPDEIGEPDPYDPQLGTLFPRRVEVARLPQEEDGASRCLVRLPIPEGGEVPQQFVEGVFTSSLAAADRLTSHARTLMVILVASGALFLLYRRLREHFRDISRIAGNLQASPEVLAHELDSLRVADSLGGVAQSWNSLIDMVEQLRGESRRASASEELRQVLERSTGGELADALNALPDGLIYITDGQTLRYANSMALRLSGWNRPENGRVQLSEIETSALGTKLVATISVARRGDGSFESRAEVVEDSAQGSSYRVRVLPLHRHGLGECVVVITDISQQVRADRAREDFVSQVTHELRTPLTNIRAYAETLSSGMFDDPKVITDCYNVITKETRRLSRLIEDILSISQMEVGSIQLVQDDVDLRTLLSEAARDVRGLADEKDIDLQMALPSKLGTVRGDRDKLAVVINNLLGNALKYTPSGGSVCLGCKLSETGLMITVKDTGIGIDAEDHERIFEKFQRANDPDVQNEAGTGIGLTTAREIVRRHGGDIELMSTKGKGSTFVVKIPISASADLRVGLAAE